MQGGRHVYGIEGAQNRQVDVELSRREVQSEVHTVECCFYIFYLVSENRDLAIRFYIRALMHPCVYEPLAREYLHLCISDALETFEILYMLGPYNTHDRVVRLYELGDFSYVTRPSRTHLHYVYFGIRRQGFVYIPHDAPEGVNASGCGVYALFVPNDLGDEVLYAGLSVACRDAYYYKVGHVFEFSLRLKPVSVKKNLLYGHRSGNRDRKWKDNTEVVAAACEHKKVLKEGKCRQKGEKALDSPGDHQLFVELFVPEPQSRQICEIEVDPEVYAGKVVGKERNKEIDQVPVVFGVVQHHPLYLVAVPLKIGSEVPAECEYQQYV